MRNSITYAAMDTHKKQHKVALLYPGDDEIIEFAIKNTASEIRKMVKKIKKQTSGEIKFCYEAGVCGFNLQRRIESLGCDCSVIAPSLTPTKPGERIKTDRRDAKKLLSMFMAGLLTDVYPPDPRQEAARELTRCRGTAKDNLKRIRHQILKFLTRHGYIYAEGSHWTQKHLAWLRSLEFDQVLVREVFGSYFTEMQHCIQRLDSLDKQLQALADSEPYREIVGIIRCFRGIDTLTAISVLTEIFNFGRFSSAQQFMSYLGLTPSESSSGDKQHKGPITKTGNKRVRRLLIEAGWNSRRGCNISAPLKKRREGQPQWAIDIADRAGERLGKRYYRLISRGKMPCKVVVALARELAGFIWWMLQEYEARIKKKAA